MGRPGIVHRLDKDTSGLLAVAKTDAAQASLMRQFGDRSIEKKYLALVRGEVPASRGRIEAPVGRDPGDRQRMAVVAGGRDSVTEYEMLGSAGAYALLALRPRTGRTHQIRAHLAYLRLPIAGDLRYGGGIGPGGLQRQFLHAAGLTLDRPTDGRRLRAWSELPQDLVVALSLVGISGARLPVGVGAALEEGAR
jgi:23S rRNA pseudouridine1911/1915/1917 synthase